MIKNGITNLCLSILLSFLSACASNESTQKTQEPTITPVISTPAPDPTPEPEKVSELKKSTEPVTSTQSPDTGDSSPAKEAPSIPGPIPAKPSTKTMPHTHDGHGPQVDTRLADDVDGVEDPFEKQNTFSQSKPQPTPSPQTENLKAFSGKLSSCKYESALTSVEISYSAMALEDPFESLDKIAREECTGTVRGYVKIPGVPFIGLSDPYQMVGVCTYEEFGEYKKDVLLEYKLYSYLRDGSFFCKVIGGTYEKFADDIPYENSTDSGRKNPSTKPEPSAPASGDPFQKYYQREKAALCSMLKISANAPHLEVMTEFRKMALILHPDKNKSVHAERDIRMLINLRDQYISKYDQKNGSNKSE